MRANGLSEASNGSGPSGRYDVVVVGAGNAALCAALAAAEGGARVLVLEKAPEAERGGNSFFSGGLFRFPFGGLEDIERLVGELPDADRERVDIAPYSEADFTDDLMRLTDGMADADLSRTLVRDSYNTVRWMAGHGVRWVLAYGRQSYEVDGKFRFWGGLVCEVVGAGAGLVDSLFDACTGIGVEVTYDAMGDELALDGRGAIAGIRTRGAAGFSEIECSSVVLACGGFEANPEMRVRYLGPGWEYAPVRGTAANTGDGIRMALAAGARPFGNYSGCHAVAWDAGAPPYGDRRIGDLYQKHSYPLGLIVNRDGERFVDEGADIRNYTYARYGKEILKQPGRIAFQIFDQQVIGRLRDEYRIREVTSATAETVAELAEALDIDVDGLVSTVAAYNDSVRDGEYNPAILDGKGTDGVDPPKSNWALRLDSPPYVGYAVKCGITFTFGGLQVDTGARVIDTQSRAIPGLYAAGELVGGLFYENYPGGSGLTAGAVFGRIAGRGAAEYAGAVN
ncbi:MAG: FAD-dependent tricarballylate dehydrogenase TcuA [Chloroflexi bacterium]|nr:FAD-dependent tricarballylate dehydrogenase TcuA [Chloroflexota bacterium]